MHMYAYILFHRHVNSHEQIYFLLLFFGIYLYIQLFSHFLKKEKPPFLF